MRRARIRWAWSIASCRASALQDTTTEIAAKIARMPRLGLTLTKQAVNHVEELQGKRAAMDAAFAWHHFAHAHNELVSGDKLGGYDARKMAESQRPGAMRRGRQRCKGRRRSRMSATLHTPLCDLLGCRYPIVQTAMGWVADARLVAATCNAGGFGFLAGATLEAERVEAEILRVKELTDKPFGINFHMFQPNAAQVVDLAIKHRLRAVSYGRGPDAKTIRRFKDAGVMCIPTVGAPKHAAKAVELGADAVTVQGAEGGGHTGSMPTTLAAAASAGCRERAGDRRRRLLRRTRSRGGARLRRRRHRDGYALSDGRRVAGAALDARALRGGQRSFANPRVRGAGRLAAANDRQPLSAAPRSVRPAAPHALRVAHG